jgi:hypothetical protein
MLSYTGAHSGGCTISALPDTYNGTEQLTNIIGAKAVNKQKPAIFTVFENLLWRLFIVSIL